MKPCLPGPLKTLAAFGLLLGTPWSEARDKHPGEAPYLICAACHGRSGEGTGAGPPLAGSEWVNGPAENLIRIQLRGLEGPIRVKGVTYDFPGGMAPLAYQSDEQIAAVLSYVRQSFGNNAPPVSPEEVRALRHEEGKPKLREADLTAAGAPSSSSGDSRYDNLEVSSKGWTLPLVLVSAAIAVVVTIVVRMRRAGS